MMIQEVRSRLDEYYVRRDLNQLRDAIELIEAELQEPELQETLIEIRLFSSEVNEITRNMGGLNLSLEDVNVDGKIESEKLIRVRAVDQDENSCIVMHVLFVDTHTLILSPCGEV